MGSSQSYPGLTEELLEDYTTLTYLSKGEILYLMKKFHSIGPEKMEADYNHRFYKDDIMKMFGAIRNNPFRDRIFKVFSSLGDDCFSFDDLVDFSSVMSPDCPAEVKAVWAFKLYDLDDDNQISVRDVCEILDRLTASTSNTRQRCIDQPSKEKIAQVILQEINLDNTGSIGLNEFKYIISRLPEFESSFYLRF